MGYPFVLCKSLRQHLHLVQSSTWASWSTSEPSLQAPLLYAPSHVQCVCGISETAPAVGQREFLNVCCLPLSVSPLLSLLFFSLTFHCMLLFILCLSQVQHNTSSSWLWPICLRLCCKNGERNPQRVTSSCQDMNSHWCWMWLKATGEAIYPLSTVHGTPPFITKSVHS